MDTHIPRKEREHMRENLKDAAVLTAGATLAVGAALAGSCLLGVGPAAHADSQIDTFLSDMHANGFSGQYGDQSLITNASNACRQMDAGVPWFTVTNSIWLGTSLDSAGAQQFVSLAARDLCPWHYAGDTGPGTYGGPDRLGNSEGV